MADMLILAEEVHAFEEENEMVRRVMSGPGATTPHDWEGPMVAVSSEIGTRWTGRCFVMVGGFDQLMCSRLNCSNRDCRTSPSRAPVSMHMRMMSAARRSSAAFSAAASLAISSFDRKRSHGVSVQW